MRIGLLRRRALQERIEALRPLKLVQHESIRSQIRDVFRNINIHAVDDGHHHNQRSGRDHYAEQRQKRTQFMTAQRLERHPEGLAGSHPPSDARPFVPMPLPISAWLWIGTATRYLRPSTYCR